MEYTVLICHSPTLIRLHQMHETLTILTYVRGVSLSVTRLKSEAAHAVYVVWGHSVQP